MRCGRLGPREPAPSAVRPGGAVTTSAAAPGAQRGRLPLLRAAHLGPSVAVTTVVAAAGRRAGPPDVPGGRRHGGGLRRPADHRLGQRPARRGPRPAGRSRRQAAGHRRAGALPGRACLAVAGVACVVLSLLVGWRSALVHLGLGVGSGHLYNLRLKSSPWSWVPYAVAFGTLPAVVTLADVPPSWPPVWMMVSAAVARGRGPLPQHAARLRGRRRHRRARTAAPARPRADPSRGDGAAGGRLRRPRRSGRREPRARRPGRRWRSSPCWPSSRRPAAARPPSWPRSPSPWSTSCCSRWCAG